MSNISGRFVASHNGNGHWTVLDGEANELILNIVPVRFTGDLGQVADLPTYTTVEARDLARVLIAAIEGVHMGGWEDAGDMPEGVRVKDLVAEAREIIEKHGITHQSGGERGK